MKNTKEVALFEVRYGRESELPEALHQGEIGLAWDTNRLFIGNKANTDLKNRIEYPYKNLEILTEYSDMEKILTYTYLNNIDNAEKFPIIVISTQTPEITDACTLTIQTPTAGGDVSFVANETFDNIINKINSKAIEGIRAYKNDNDELVLVAYDSRLVLSGSAALTQLYLVDKDTTNSENLPQRYIRNKLDDFVTSADFGIIGDDTDSSEKIISALIELYNKNTVDEQYYRTFKILAGNYTIGGSQTLPLLSNMHLKGDGKDKTVLIMSRDFSGSNVFTSTDTNLSYENGKRAFNTIIEDMTIDMSELPTYNGYLLLLNNCQNITFRNVRFIGNINLKFANILNSSNITFENCNVDNFYSGILGNTVTRLFLRDTIFNTTYDSAVKLSNSIGLTMNSNTFIECAQTSGSIVDISNNCSYSTIIQSNFDANVITNYSKLFKRVANDYLNYIDTLDASTNERKLLKFKFLQPKWEYIDYLTNQNGKTAVVIDNSKYKTNSQNYPLADNPLNIDTTGSLTLENLGTDDLVLKSHKTSDVVIGDYDELIGNIGQIQIKKPIQLNDNKITNSEGTGPVIIETAENGIIEVGDNTTYAPYEQRILGNDDAIPNVAYVNRASGTTLHKEITYIDAVNNTENGIKIAEFDPNIYGDTIHLKNIKVNVKIPFFNMFKYMNVKDAVTYSNGYRYNKGEIVMAGGNYGVVLNDHTATSSTFNSNVMQLSLLTDAKYVDVIAVNRATPSIQYYLTRDIESDAQMENYPLIDITEKNMRNYYPPIVATGVSSEMFMENDRIYQTLSGDPITINSKFDIHNATNFEKTADEGMNYSLDMDRIYISVNNNVPLTDTINFSGYDLYIKFSDEDYNILNLLPLNNETTGGTYTKLNPSGKLIFDISYVRG